jgi:hypothetical protein
MEDLSLAQASNLFGKSGGAVSSTAKRTSHAQSTKERVTSVAGVGSRGAMAGIGQQSKFG